jgi:hypothetical protein
MNWSLIMRRMIIFILLIGGLSLAAVKPPKDALSKAKTVYVVGRVLAVAKVIVDDKSSVTLPPVYDIMGIYLTEAEAIKGCKKDKGYFIMEVPFGYKFSEKKLNSKTTRFIDKQWAGYETPHDGIVCMTPEDLKIVKANK